MLDESAIPDDRLPPLRPDQLANYAGAAGIASVLIPYVWLFAALFAIALSARAIYLICVAEAGQRGFRRSVVAASVGIAVLIGRSLAYFLGEMSSP